MKKLIVGFVVAFLLLSCLPVWAGDIPEALSYEDDAKVFIGTLLAFSDSKLENSADAMEVTILPTLKLKGDVAVGADDTYECCYFVKTKPKEDTEYFFGWLSNTCVYAYEVKSRTEDKITLHITDEFSQRIQNYLDEGLYQQAEIARVNVGRKITLSEYMKSDKSFVEKVIFSFNDENYNIDVDEFFQFSDNALITDVKDSELKNIREEDCWEDILYIRLELKDGKNGGGFACVTRFGEVDRYNPMMGRLPKCDFLMEQNDLEKLYSFLPDNLQKELYLKNGDEMIDNESKSVAVWILVGVVSVLVIGWVIYRNNKSK